MRETEKITLLEDCMELDEGTLKLEDVLEDYEEWDSVTALSFIAMLDEKFHKALTGQELKDIKTVAEAVALME